LVYADGRRQLSTEGWARFDERLGALDLDGINRWIEVCDQDVAAWSQPEPLLDEKAPESDALPQPRGSGSLTPAMKAEIDKYRQANPGAGDRRVVPHLRTKRMYPSRQAVRDYLNPPES
jgi:hypothetical protein